MLFGEDIPCDRIAINAHVRIESRRPEVSHGVNPRLGPEETCWLVCDDAGWHVDGKRTVSARQQILNGIVASAWERCSETVPNGQVLL